MACSARRPMHTLKRVEIVSCFEANCRLHGVEALYLVDESPRAMDFSGWLVNAGARVTLCAIEVARRMSEAAFQTYTSDFDIAVLGAGPGTEADIELAARLAQRCAPLLLVDAPSEDMLERIYALGGTYRPVDATMVDFLLAARQAVDRGFPDLDRLCAHAAHLWRLPPQLQRVLQLNLWSFTDEEIARSMRLSIHTVQEYQDTLRRRTGARSKHGHLRRLLELRGAAAPTHQEDQP